MSSREELIRRYLLDELNAYGLVEFEKGQYIHRGSTRDYLIEIKVFDIGNEKPVRLIEDFSGELGYD